MLPSNFDLAELGGPMNNSLSTYIPAAAIGLRSGLSLERPKQLPAIRPS